MVGVQKPQNVCKLHDYEISSLSLSLSLSLPTSLPPSPMQGNDQGPGAGSFESPSKTGWLYKHGGSGMSSHWRKRWFVADHHYLFYYKGPNVSHNRKKKSFFRLSLDFSHFLTRVSVFLNVTNLFHLPVSLCQY